MIIPREDVLNYLTRAKELQNELPWIDLHVSPFEVIFNSFRYSPNSFEDGIFSLEDARYKPPVIGLLRMENDVPRVLNGHQPSETERMSLFLYRQAFAHIGPRVLVDQMNLSGIKKALLLPVLHPQSDGKAEMSLVNTLYGGDSRFSIGYCIPNTIENNSILSDINSAKESYGIMAIKLNANITGIDLSTSIGKTRVEAILDACQAACLPIIVHGGKSTVLLNSAAKNYSGLRHLSEIDWGITKRPVIISHGGMMGSLSIEIEQELMPRLKHILALHSHVLVDISALEVHALCHLLRSIDEERIVFGSDYHYFSQWGTIVKLFHALMTTPGRIDDRFLKIIAVNPARCIYGGLKC